MRTLNRHILIRLLLALFIVLLALVMVAWFTQILNLLDIVVVNGRSVIEFLGITLLLVPLIIAYVMPTALFIATVFVLDRMNADSELAVLGSAGISRWWLLRPFITVSMLAAMISLLATSIIQPAAMKELRQKRSEVRSDLISSLVAEGQFNAPRHGLMIHVRTKTDSGELLGVIFQDHRTPEAPVTYLARSAQLVDQGDRAFMLLTDGSVVRAHAQRPAVDLVHFNEYSLNLSSFFSELRVKRRGLEELTILELLHADPVDAQIAYDPLRIAAELHNRLSSPLYTLVAMLIAFAALCDPRTTRKNRVWAIVAATLIASVVRVLGFVLISNAGKTEGSAIFIYGVPLACMAACIVYMGFERGRGRPVSNPAPPAVGTAGSNVVAGRT